MPCEGPFRLRSSRLIAKKVSFQRESREVTLRVPKKPSYAEVVVERCKGRGTVYSQDELMYDYQILVWKKDCALYFNYALLLENFLYQARQLKY